MKAIVDLVILGILIMCAWGGYKKGLIMGIGGVLCIFVSIYGANLMANSVRFDVISALQPFASGYTEGLLNNKDSKVMKQMGWEDYDYSVDDLLARYPERENEFCATCYETLGIDEKTSEILAEQAVEYAEEAGTSVKDAVVYILCKTVSYVGCFTLAFLLLIIILTVIGNLPNLSYKLPRFDAVNDIGGVLLGVVTGLLFCMLLVWVLKFMGMIIGRDTLSSATLGRFFLNHNLLLKYLGI